MKANKKHQRKQLEKFSNVFTQLGLVLTLFIVLVTLEYQTEQKTKVIASQEVDVLEDYDFRQTPIIVREVAKTKPLKREVLKKIDLNDVEVVKDDDESNNIIIKPTDIEIETPVITSNDIIEHHIDESIDSSDDPKTFRSVEEIPVFSGCEGLSKPEARKCFDKKMRRIVQRYFDTELANELGLSSGKKRILAEFVIDKVGKVNEVKIRAPHPRLKKETEKVVGKIPKFTPGKQNGKPVKVKYVLPITFMVQ